MSLYHETAEFLTAPSNAGGSLKSRIFSKKDLKSQPAQVYALAIESCKWSSVLKEVIENADILKLERKVRLKERSLFGLHANRSSSHLSFQYSSYTTFFWQREELHFQQSTASEALWNATRADSNLSSRKLD